MGKRKASSRITASMLFAASAILPVGICIILLTAGAADTSEVWKTLGFMFSSQNEHLALFIVLFSFAIVAVGAAAVTATQRPRAVLRAVFAVVSLQSCALALVGLWPYAVVCAIPLWWLFKAQHAIHEPLDVSAGHE